MSNLNQQNLKSGYENRVRDKKDYAANTNQVSKKLELEEAQLLNKLQKTYQVERHMTEVLNKTSDASPVKQLKAQKQASNISQTPTAASPTKEWNKKLRRPFSKRNKQELQDDLKN